VLCQRLVYYTMQWYAGSPQSLARKPKRKRGREISAFGALSLRPESPSAPQGTGDGVELAR
jgi:hypothetical protein